MLYANVRLRRSVKFYYFYTKISIIIKKQAVFTQILKSQLFLKKSKQLSKHSDVSPCLTALRA